MFSILHHYLIEHPFLHLPGIGTMSFADVPAQLNIADKQLMPPQRSLRLDVADDRKNGQRLMGFICKEMGVSEEEAHDRFRQFCEELRSGLASGKSMVWDDLGAFHKDENGVVRFEQSSDLDRYLLPVTAERIIRQDAVHSMTVGDTETTNTAMQEYYEEKAPEAKDRWWIAAVIILLISGALIAYRYMQ